MVELLERRVPMDGVKSRVISDFSSVFEMEFAPAALESYRGGKD